MNNMNGESKSCKCCEGQRETAPREVAQVLTEIIDDLEWSYAAMLEWHQGEPEDIRDLDANYKALITQHSEDRDFYGDGTPIGARHLDPDSERVACKPMEPPHRRCECAAPQSAPGMRECSRGSSGTHQQPWELPC